MMRLNLDYVLVWLILLLSAFLFLDHASGALNDVDKQYFWTKNLLLNGGAENGKGSGVHKWTASAGTFATATSGSNLLTGRVSFTWDAAASADTLSYGQITVPNGLKGKNGLAICKTMVPSGTATHSFQVYDGTNVLGSVTIVSSTTPTYQYASFIWPSSGYVLPRLYANANEPSVTLDDCWLGDASEVNISPISQAVLVGSAYIEGTTNCASWARSSATLGAFSTDADCNGPTVEFNAGPGTIQTTDADLPQFTVNNLPPGTYEVHIEGGEAVPNATDDHIFAISDGTNTRGGFSSLSTTSSAAGMTVTAIFNYTTSGNRTFAVFGATASAGSLTLRNRNTRERIYFYITRFPSSNEMAYKPSQVPFYWEGTHGTTCSWTIGATTISSPQGDSSCTFTEAYNYNAGAVTTTFFGGSVSLTPGIVFQPPRVGLYDVCADAITGGTGSQIRTLALVSADLATVYDTKYATAGAAGYSYSLKPCARVNYTNMSAGSVTINSRIASDSGTISLSGGALASVQYSIRWTISDAVNRLTAPLLVNSVNTQLSSVLAYEAATINCDGGSAITSQDGAWVSSVGNISAGACVVTLAAGAFSSAPRCIAQDIAVAGDPSGISAVATSATSVTVDCVQAGGTTDCTSYDFNLYCRAGK